MIRRKEGVAALFDAMMFLAIAAVVSVALLSTFSGQQDEVAGRMQEEVEAAHLVLLRSTVVDGMGNAHPIEELFKLGEVNDNADENITTILDLLIPGSDWRWTVERGGLTHSISTMPTWPGEGAVFCSVIRAPIDGGEICFRLEVRPA